MNKTIFATMLILLLALAGCDEPTSPNTTPSSQQPSSIGGCGLSGVPYENVQMVQEVRDYL